MELNNSFSLPVSADRLWEVLTDVERIAPCVPGFKLVEADHPDFRGSMTVKVGAVSVVYDATITFAERDDDARRAVLAVRGKEKRGSGTVTANVTARIVPTGDASTAEMTTDVALTGRVAQFGRGIIGDVSDRITKQFVDNLESQVLPASEPSEPSEPTASATGSAPGLADPALDLGAVAAGPLLKRAAPVALLLLVLLALFRRARS